ncbi:SE-domain-containing protein [Ophiobolus disseminans]|uniref:Squalene monooxygenase n=1 Tax=Ophiobolus disseminans TaxID=1469910 RepID=A0A6A7A568_9PLEO|nr:SE-domain-containing protein [Ophiobolus disseminans]
MPVRGYHIYWKDEEVTFYYPALSYGGAPSSGSCQGNRRVEGRSFHHGRFVSRLRDLAKNEENVTVVEGTVISLVSDKQTGRVIGVEYTDNKKQSKKSYSNLVIIADGSRSNLRSQLHQQQPISTSRFRALELLDVQLPHHSLAYGILGPNPPILVYQIGARETRILIDIPNALHDKILQDSNVRTYIKEAVVPTLPPAVQTSATAALESGRLRSMPNEYLPSRAVQTPGVLIIGDASNIRHALTGSGMTVALKDIVLLRDTLGAAGTAFADADAMHKKPRHFYWKRKDYSVVLNVLAQALYTLFGTTGNSTHLILHSTDIDDCGSTPRHPTTRIHSIHPIRRHAR